MEARLALAIRVGMDLAAPPGWPPAFPAGLRGPAVSAPEVPGVARLWTGPCVSPSSASWRRTMANRSSSFFRSTRSQPGIRSSRRRSWECLPACWRRALLAESGREPAPNAAEFKGAEPESRAKQS